MYSDYCKNRSNSETLVNEGAECQAFFKGIQRNLAHALDLNAYLLRPVQRITKYAQSVFWHEKRDTCILIWASVAWVKNTLSFCVLKGALLYLNLSFYPCTELFMLLFNYWLLPPPLTSHSVTGHDEAFQQCSQGVLWPPDGSGQNARSSRTSTTLYTLSDSKGFQWVHRIKIFCKKSIILYMLWHSSYCKNRLHKNRRNF